MLIQDEELRIHTLKRMEIKRAESLSLEPILKGGSDRRFFRATWEKKSSCIVMAYGLEREENALFTGIGRFLENIHVEVPRILAEDAEKRLVWLEDLGAADLWSFREQAWSERAPHYRSALEQANLLHREGYERAQAQGLQLMPGFDSSLYAWERTYFYDKFVRVACQVELDQERRGTLEDLLVPGAELLLQERPCLVHRDFQSQNLMVRNGWVYLIDFQGMRQGASFYDLASLLYDPYVRLSPEERLEMLTFYFVLPGPRPKRQKFNELFRFAAIQRLMQALGAYGFLGIEKGKPDFLKHVEPALQNLQSVVEESSGMEPFLELIQECRKSFPNRN
jgi:N-acetylmuramate 1-kinase